MFRSGRFCGTTSDSSGTQHAKYKATRPFCTDPRLVSKPIPTLLQVNYELNLFPGTGALVGKLPTVHPDGGGPSNHYGREDWGPRV